MYVKKDFPYRVLTGQKFGKLSIAGEAEKMGQSRAWVCVCDCGNTVMKRTGAILNASFPSCGCVSGTRSGVSKNRFYYILKNIIARCHRPGAKGFGYYGARGITVCEEWRNDSSAFFRWAESNYVRGYSLDRIDNDGPYAPWNCRYASRAVQANNKRTSRIFIINGISKSLKQWCVLLGLKYPTVRRRVVRGVNIEDALSDKSCKNITTPKTPEVKSNTP